MREIELKEEEEELKQCVEALKKRKGELRTREEQLEKCKKKCVTSFYCTSTLCVVISINMCCNPNLFYILYFNFLYNCFLKFVVYKMNYEMVKFKMVC
jgi:hypothetical protein